VATFSVPLDFIAAGTCEATVGLDPDAPVFTIVTEVELVLLLLLPQPASARIISAGTPTAATSFLMRISCDVEVQA
jgi:hypothetical protein